MKQSDLERAFAFYLNAAKLPKPVAEYRFAPPRNWRFDFAYPDPMIAIELEGATWTNGRHTRGDGFQKDIEKYNEAAVRGWCVLRFTRADVEMNRAIPMVKRALEARREERAS